MEKKYTSRINEVKNENNAITVIKPHTLPYLNWKMKETNMFIRVFFFFEK